MCLQWCHVRNLLIDNDLDCGLWCPDAIRLARQAERCESCAHFFPARRQCRLTGEKAPLARTCCHHNIPLRRLEKVVLRLGETVPPQLLQAHGIRSLAELFLVVDSAPAPPPGNPADGIELDARCLSVPLVYGVRARCWEKALYGQDPFGWCEET